ncbi:hypothetical protein DdX_21373 [Ditylenchus destructor]|uniref:Uncharacterized protein n=1 Tax=Ditylenchus destructor TaxID=166010 RepID=A0AAD4MF03_9BILA|nr:hypothetical protein DdX_21373 [Ditylenchus destructor]
MQAPRQLPPDNSHRDISHLQRKNMAKLLSNGWVKKDIGPNVGRRTNSAKANVLIVTITVLYSIVALVVVLALCQVREEFQPTGQYILDLNGWPKHKDGEHSFVVGSHIFLLTHPFFRMSDMMQMATEANDSTMLIDNNEMDNDTRKSAQKSARQSNPQNHTKNAQRVSSSTSSYGNLPANNDNGSCIL